MIPIEVALENFLCYDDNGGNGYHYDFKDHRLWSISGDNGAGKSAIFDAITYTLFGRHRGGATRDEELIRKGANQMLCTFTFEHNGRQYRITRAIKKRTKRSGEAAYDRACQLDWYDIKSDAWREVSGTSTASALEDHVRTVLLGFDYDTFISSVLLLQGDSDKLIRAGPRDRFTYLAGILDLRQYKRLEDRATGKARTLRDQHQLLANTLQEVGIPKQDEVDQAAARAADAELAANNSQLRLQQAQERLKRVESYHELAHRRIEVTKKVTEMTEALAHAKEIRAAIDEKRTLNQILPRLGDALTALKNGRLAEEEVRKALQQLAKIDVAALGVAVTERDEKLRQVKEEHQRQGDILRANRQSQRDLDAELQLGRRLEMLWKSIQTAVVTIANLEKAITALPGLRMSQTRLEALDRARPVIKAYQEAREEEAVLLGQFRDVEPDAVIEELASRRQAAEGSLDKLRQLFEERQAEVGQLEGELTAARRTLQDRERAGSEASCSRCGQPISEQHIKREVVNCKKQITETAVALADARSKLKTDKAAVADVETRLNGLRQQEQQAHERVHQLMRVRQRLAGLANEEALTELPEEFRKALEGPTDQIDSRLEPFRQELIGLKKLRLQVADLSGREADLRSQKGLIAGWEVERAEVLTKITVERAAEVVKKAAELEIEMAALEARDVELANEVAGAHAELDAARKREAEALQKRNELQIKAQVQATAAEGHRTAAASSLRGVPPQYLPPSEQKIGEVQKRLLELADAEERLALLESAEKQLDTLQGRINELDEALAKVVDEDRIPIDDARKAVELGRQASRVAQEAARSARERAITLRKEREERLAMERQAEALARGHKIWERLAKLLGRGGIQLALMKRDLAEIEKLANVMLAKISGGSLQVAIECLRGRTGEEIVFRCVDASSADEPLDIAFLSGGQKFRVAVALAVGIGQYAGLGGSMPSQIIDEGFGSLDDNGRNEMLSTIREMSEHFERIIVVSHTDSFHDPALFPARYELRKEGRKTLVMASV